MKLSILLPILLIASATSAAPTEASKQSAKKPGEIVWLTDFAKAQKLAKKKKTWILVDFFATWCGPCKKLDFITYKDPRVQAFASKYVAVKIDVDLPRNRDVSIKYQAMSLPSVGFIKADGTFVGGFTGYRDADQLLALLEPLAKAKR